MKKKLVLMTFIIINFMLFLYCSERVLCLDFFDDKNIYNVDVGDNLIVYEYEKIVDEKSIHYVGMLNKNDGSFIDIESNNNEIINSSMFFPSISDDDRYITFTSNATNITNDLKNSCFDVLDYNYGDCSNVYIYDVENKQSMMIKNKSEYLNGHSYVSKISGNGRFVAFESLATNNLNFNNIDECIYEDENICMNIYSYDILTDTITLISTSSNNYGGNFNSIYPSISSDGRYITFQTSSTNLINESYDFNNCRYATSEEEMMCSHIYLFDNNSNKLKLITQSNNQLFNDNSGNAIVSDLGNVVVYESYATNIENKYNNKQHVILYDIAKNTNVILSKKGDVLNNRDSYLSDLSYNGKYVAIMSNSTNLDESGQSGVYIYNTNNMKVSLYQFCQGDRVLATIKDNNILYYDEYKSVYQKIDLEAPIIKKDQYIYVLKDSNVLLKDKVIVSDNLCDDVKLITNDNLLFNKIGEFDVLLVAIDSFENISSEYIKVIVLDEDKDAPVFSDVNEIKVLKGSMQLNLSNYIEAVDLVDGRTQIYIINDGNLNLKVKGKYRVKLMSKDNANNIAYKELDIVVYENYNFSYYYEILIIIGLIAVIIFSIIKVK